MPKTPKNNYGLTPLHIACDLGYFEIAEMLTQIPRLNVKDKCKGDTAFHLACKSGHSRIVDMIMNKADSLNIDLNAKNNFDCTPFHLACMSANSYIPKNIIEKSKQLNINLNATNLYTTEYLSLSSRVHS